MNLTVLICIQDHDGLPVFSHTLQLFAKQQFQRYRSAYSRPNRNPLFKQGCHVAFCREIMTTGGVQGCKFCEIVQHNKDVQLMESNNVILIRDYKPKTSHHYLAISKSHISKPTDLTHADIPLLEEMASVGREFLRKELKAKGEADTVEDMIRLGFHWPPMLRIHHLHLHVMYPVSKLGLISRYVTFKPGVAFKSLNDLIDELKEDDGAKDPLAGNPARDDTKVLNAHEVSN